MSRNEPMATPQKKQAPAFGELFGNVPNGLNAILVRFGELLFSTQSGHIHPSSVIVDNTGVQGGSTHAGLLGC